MTKRRKHEPNEEPTEGKTVHIGPQHFFEHTNHVDRRHLKVNHQHKKRFTKAGLPETREPARFVLDIMVRIFPPAGGEPLLACSLKIYNLKSVAR